MAENQLHRGRAPASVDRVDPGNYVDHGELPHVHFTDGSALNVDGTWKYGGKLLTSKEKKWLKSYGWKMPAGQ